jgi:hypothetical protein
MDFFVYVGLIYFMISSFVYGILYQLYMKYEKDIFFPNLFKSLVWPFLIVAFIGYWVSLCLTAGIPRKR